MKKMCGLFILGILYMPYSYATDVSYPADVDTDIEKLQYSYMAQEKLQQEHNAMGAKLKEGTITEEEWKEYKENEFMGKQVRIIEELQKYKALVKGSKQWDIDLDIY